MVLPASWQCSLAVRIVLLVSLEACVLDWDAKREAPPGPDELDAGQNAGDSDAAIPVVDAQTGCDADAADAACGPTSLECPPCGLNEVCDLSVGLPVCVCEQGFAIGGSGACTAMSSCAEQHGGCHPLASCTDSPAGPSCLCDAPFEGSGRLCSCPLGTTGSACLACDFGFTRDGFGACRPASTLKVEPEGDGSGSVQLPDGSTCKDKCVVQLVSGTTATLWATPSRYAWLRGWGSANCQEVSCTVVLDGDITLRPKFELKYNVAFLTSTSYAGHALGGLTGADQKCAERAAAAGLHGSTWRALLSSPGENLTSTADDVSASDRLEGARGWLTSDGRPLLDRAADIVSSGAISGLSLDEYGLAQMYGPQSPWTGSDHLGQQAYLDGADLSCGGWNTTSAAGRLGDPTCVGGPMLSFGTSSCDDARPLFCFGVDTNSPLEIEPAPGRLAFVTQETWASGAGRDSADALCASEASSARLTGAYKALLSLSDVPAHSRFNMEGAPWVTVDGIPLVLSASDLASGRWLAPIRVTATGAKISRDYRTGGLDGKGSTCLNWTATASSMGAVQNGSVLRNRTYELPCGSATSIACFQE